MGNINNKDLNMDMKPENHLMTFAYYKLTGRPYNICVNFWRTGRTVLEAFHKSIYNGGILSRNPELLQSLLQSYIYINSLGETEQQDFLCAFELIFRRAISEVGNGYNMTIADAVANLAKMVRIHQKLQADAWFRESIRSYIDGESYGYNKRDMQVYLLGVATYES